MKSTLTQWGKNKVLSWEVERKPNQGPSQKLDSYYTENEIDQDQNLWAMISLSIFPATQRIQLLFQEMGSKALSFCTKK